MGVILNILDGLLVVSMLCTSYPQKMWITSVKTVDNNISIIERRIVKNLDYLKEDITFPVVKGGKDQKNVSLINNMFYKDILISAQRDEQAAKEQFSYGVKPTFPYEINSKFIVTKENDKILSLYNDFYEYLGGAHGNTVRTSYTIDKSTEKLISLKDLFKPEFDYKDIINKKVAEVINKNPENYFYSSSSYKGIDENTQFFIRDDMLIIYYQLYEIAPYVAGIPEFEIPLELFGDNYVYN